MYRSIALWGLAEAIATYGFATHMGNFEVGS